MKKVVDFDALNQRATARSHALEALIEKLRDLPLIRLSAERLSFSYDKLVQIRKSLDDEALVALPKELVCALDRIKGVQEQMAVRSKAISGNPDSIDMFPETLMLMKAAGTTIDLGQDYTDDPNDPVWIPPEGTDPFVSYSHEDGHYMCRDMSDAGSGIYYGPNPTAAYVAWRQGREWIPEAPQ